MKKSLVWAFGVLFVVSAAAALVPAEKGKIVLKAGDEVYACNCGASCPCQMISRNEGKCGCGVPMVKAKVKSVGKGTAVLMIGDKEQTFKTVGKYACACPAGCTCDSISQTPAKCTCGVDMVKVGK
jgi:hypothetical protein